MGGPTRSAPLLILCPADRDGGSGRSAGAPAPPSSPGAFGTTLALRYLAVCSQARVALSGVPAAAGTGGKRACWSGPLGLAALVRRTRARPRRELSGRSAFAAQRDMLAFCRTAGKRFSLAVLIACIMRRSARLLLLAVTAASFFVETTSRCAARPAYSVRLGAPGFPVLRSFARGGTGALLFTWFRGSVTDEEFTVSFRTTGCSSLPGAVVGDRTGRLR